MNDIVLFLQLTVVAQICILSFVACATGLFVLLLAAPRRDCFFLKWPVEKRLIVLLASPALLIFWPVVLYSWILEVRGFGPDDDLDWDDD